MSPKDVPGVYIEESPGGSHDITGVATSVTAFLGRAPRGPVDGPRMVHSFLEYHDNYGGLSPDSSMSYAVRDFFANGGRQAVIQRLYRAPEGEANPTASLSPGELKLVAASPGEWGRNLTARLDQAGIGEEKDASSGLEAEDWFNLEVTETRADGSIVLQESFAGITTWPEAGARRVDRILAQESRLVRLGTKEDGSPDLPKGNPALVMDATDPVTASGGADSAALEENDYQAGLAMLDQADLINLLCIPADQRAGWTSKSVYQRALAYCARRRAVLIVDPNPAWIANLEDFLPQAEWKLGEDLGLEGVEARNAALYFPRVLQPDPLKGSPVEIFPPCGLIAGVIARTDERRGVWRAPAGAEAVLTGVEGLEVDLGNRENEVLNRLGINCLRSFPTRGALVWGARTLRGADHYQDDYKYVPVRRLALYIEESLERGMQWAAYEPNGEPLWTQVRMSVNAFLHALFLQGAFSGSTPGETYFVRCGADTISQADLDAGVVNLEVGFAPVKPAEFLILKFRLQAGQAAA